MTETGNYLDQWYNFFITPRNEKAGCPELIQGHVRVLQDSDLPDWVRLGLYSDLALLYIESGDVENGLQVLEKAIVLGFNDFIFLQGNEAYKQLFDREEFQVLYSKMRISEADALELFWVYTEIQAIRHDINMMIIENMNRPDDDYTRIPQAQISTRTPQSLTIFPARHKLQMWQQYQQETVLNADIQRISHNTNMRIINAIGESHTDNYMKEMISRRQAQDRLEARAMAVRQREFILPPDVSIIPEQCPALGSF